jgi:hypothetical protein
VHQRFTVWLRVAGCLHQLVVELLKRRALERPWRVIDGGVGEPVAEARIEAPSGGEEVLERSHV